MSRKTENVGRTRLVREFIRTWKCQGRASERRKGNSMPKRYIMAVVFVVLCCTLAPAEQKPITLKTVAHVRAIVLGSDGEIDVPFGADDYLCPAGFDGASEKWGPQIRTYAPRWDKLHGGSGHGFWRPACISRRDMPLSDKDLGALLHRLGFVGF